MPDHIIVDCEAMEALAKNAYHTVKKALLDNLLH